MTSTIREGVVRVVVFALLAFSSASLLFAGEPMLAKWLLPSFGGSPATWSASLAAFQLLLLLGYAYAHWCSSRLPVRMQGRVHALLALLALSFCVWFARGVSLSAVPPLSDLSPALAIVWLLVSRVGLSFVLLASTTGLLSRWWALERSSNPAWLFAVSNAGSLAGLLLYPLAIELLWSGSQQLLGWCALFGVFALASGTLGLVTLSGVRDSAVVGARAATRTSWWSWLGCGFVPSVLLLAASNHISVDIAATPLLWTLPLAAYLVSLIIAFGLWRSSFRPVVLTVWLLASAGVAVGAFRQGSASLWEQVGVTLLALFAAALLLHGELAVQRPAADELPYFYLTLALGGALGGAFVSFVAPLLFADYYELELGAALVFLLLPALSRRGGWSVNERRLSWLGAGICLPLLLGSVVVRMQGHSLQGRVVERSRSFLGPLRVVDTPRGRLLVHGRIQHGMQLSEPGLHGVPTMYFARGTALARVLTVPGQQRKIGVVGLGVGTIASYARSGDRLRFYELDPDVVALARRDFSFLRDSPGKTEVVIGDGRLLLAAEPPQQFDVLVLDAFTSDAVPVHLLTEQAFGVYTRQMAEQGVLLANVSNRHLQVERVVRGSAAAVGLECEVVETASDANAYITHVSWAVMMRDGARLHALLAGLAAVEPRSPAVHWTDERTRILSIVR